MGAQEAALKIVGVCGGSGTETGMKINRVIGFVSSFLPYAIGGSGSLAADLTNIQTRRTE
jgi:hypothetical protein